MAGVESASDSLAEPEEEPESDSLHHIKTVKGKLCNALNYTAINSNLLDDPDESDPESSDGESSFESSSESCKHLSYKKIDSNGRTRFRLCIPSFC